MCKVFDLSVMIWVFGLVISGVLSFTSSLSCSPVLRLLISLVSFKLFLLLFLSCVPDQSCSTLCLPDCSLVCTFCKLFKIKRGKNKTKKTQTTTPTILKVSFDPDRRLRALVSVDRYK